MGRVRVELERRRREVEPAAVGGVATRRRKAARVGLLFNGGDGEWTGVTVEAASSERRSQSRGDDVDESEDDDDESQRDDASNELRLHKTEKPR